MGEMPNNSEVSESVDGARLSKCGKFFKAVKDKRSALVNISCNAYASVRNDTNVKLNNECKRETYLHMQPQLNQPGIAYGIPVSNTPLEAMS